MKNENNTKLKFLSYCYNKIFDAPYEIINDPINKLFKNYNEIQIILKLEDLKKIKFIYFNKLTIHKILIMKKK